MLLRESLVLKFGAVDGLAAGAIAIGKVTTLDHELLDDAMEDGALVVEGLPSLANALLARAKGTEVLDCLGDKFIIELHGDTTGGLAPDLNVEKDTGSLCLGHCNGIPSCGTEHSARGDCWGMVLESENENSIGFNKEQVVRGKVSTAL